MKNKYRFGIFLFFMLSLCSCGMFGYTEKKDEQTGVVLTERQKQILRDADLPEEYESLPDSQKNAIEKIEDALSYLEEKYGVEFKYGGYVSGGLYPSFDGEYVLAQLKDAPLYDETYIKVNISYEDKEFHYSDDYQEICAVPEYEAALDEALRAMAGEESDFFIKADIIQLTDSDDYIISRAYGGATVFVLNRYSSKDEAEDLVNQYAEWIASLDCQYPTGATFFFQDEVDFVDTDEFNYSDQIHAHKYRYEYDVSMNSDGDIRVTDWTTD